MHKLRITTDKIIIMDGIEGCDEISPWDNRPIDYKYSFEENPKYRYYDIMMNGEHKTIAVNGKVELIENPMEENIIDTWDKIK